LAWLHAVPENKSSSEKSKPRWEILELRESPLLQLPEVKTDKHILDWLIELSFCDQGFSGPVPLSYQELDAWARLTNVLLTWEEARYIKMLSQEYCSQYSKSGQRDAPPPYTTVDFDQQALADKVLASFRSHSRYRGN